VRGDTDIAVALDGGFTGHVNNLPYLSQTAVVPVM
jgi:hypothetical protein